MRQDERERSIKDILINWKIQNTERKSGFVTFFKCLQVENPGVDGSSADDMAMVAGVAGGSDACDVPLPL